MLKLVLNFQIYDYEMILNIQFLPVQANFYSEESLDYKEYLYQSYLVFNKNELNYSILYYKYGMLSIYKKEVQEKIFPLNFDDDQI